MIKNKKKTIKKPLPPVLSMIEHQSVKYEFNWVSKKVSWLGFQEWAAEQIPAGATNVTLELIEEWQYDDCLTALEIAWDLKRK
jgi:hypothetical protein